MGTRQWVNLVPDFRATYGLGVGQLRALDPAEFALLLAGLPAECATIQRELEHRRAAATVRENPEPQTVEELVAALARHPGGAEVEVVQRAR